MNWTETLLNWYEENRRDFPWRNTRDPYRIWLSEIILQQTRTAQGLPYYESFLAHFPTVFDLATAEEEKVLKLWQGLGYYSRARNLHASAQWIVQENNGVFPQEFKSLLQLKGVGDYTASAIASICYNEPQAVVDGNVYRFLSRYFGISTPIDASNALKTFKEKATALMNGFSPNLFNQAVMEFGALQCTPKQAQCDSCPFHTNCFAFQQQQVYAFPIKAKRTKVRKRYFNYVVLKTPSGKTVAQQRTTKGIWQNLYEFPLLESEAPLSQKQLLTHKDFPQAWKATMKGLFALNETPVKHLLSHQQLFIRFWELQLTLELDGAITIDELESLPVPVVIQHFIENYSWG